MKNMCKALAIALCGGVLAAGCSVTKIEYEKNDKGEVSYRLYRNDHWLKTESTGIRGGMSDAGKFEFAAEGMKASPSEEFNRTMQTYTTAFVQLAQIAAAAYNPSSTGVKTGNGERGTGNGATAAASAVSGQAASAAASTNAVSGQAASAATTTNAAEDCVDCAPAR